MNKMKRVLFFFEEKWAFGTIHKALCKELYQHGIYANILDWSTNLSTDEFGLLNRVYDIFVTLPNVALHLSRAGIPFDKIVVVAHEQRDLYETHQQQGLDFLNEVKQFAVISPILKTKSKELNLAREPKITPAGIHFDLFYSDTHSQLKNVGYAGAKTGCNFVGVEIKRGHLAEQAVEAVAGLRLVNHAFYYHLCMPSFYKNIDCVIQPSLEEAGGLATMEGAAAGRLIIGTPVGYLGENGDRGAGILVPLDEAGFVQKTIEYLSYYRDNPTEYQHRCASIQQFARENYDWSVMIKNWVELLA
jgi:hypothetical protein